MVAWPFLSAWFCWSMGVLLFGCVSQDTHGWILRRPICFVREIKVLAFNFCHRPPPPPPHLAVFFQFVFHPFFFSFQLSGRLRGSLTAYFTPWFKKCRQLACCSLSSSSSPFLSSLLLIITRVSPSCPLLPRPPLLHAILSVSWLTLFISVMHWTIEAAPLKPNIPP